MSEEIKMLIGEEQLVSRVKEIAEQINREYDGREIYLLCILKGSVYFTCELSKHITVPVKLGFMSVSSYGDRMTSSGAVVIDQDTDLHVKGKHVIVVEDIIDTGRTLKDVAELIKARNPLSL